MTMKCVAKGSNKQAKVKTNVKAGPPFIVRKEN